MCFESIVGYGLLTLALISYVFSRITRNVNWAMHAFYLRRWLSVW